MLSGYFRAYSNRVREASRELPERELRVYVALLSYANCRGMCWPGLKLLTEVTGLCTDAVLSALEGLLARKYVQIVRQATRDVFTGQMLPNVYIVDGALLTDDCAGDEFPSDEESQAGLEPTLGLSSNQESQQHQRTDSETKPDLTKPEKTPSSAPDSLEVEEEKPKAKSKAKTKTPERSSIPNSPSPSSARPSPRFFNGSLKEFAGSLPLEQEAVAMSIYVELEHKMPIRLARYLVTTYGETKVRWALAHLQRTNDVRNPSGFIRHLLEKDAIEQLDAAAANPGDKYITGDYADYIEH